MSGWRAHCQAVAVVECSHRRRHGFLLSPAVEWRGALAVEQVLQARRIDAWRVALHDGKLLLNSADEWHEDFLALVVEPSHLVEAVPLARDMPSFATSANSVDTHELANVAGECTDDAERVQKLLYALTVVVVRGVHRPRACRDESLGHHAAVRTESSSGRGASFFGRAGTRRALLRLGGSNVTRAKRAFSPPNPSP